jgi:hypothetical protein
MEAISHAGAAVGVLSKEGVVLAAEKKIMSKVRSSLPHAGLRLYISGTALHPPSYSARATASRSFRLSPTLTHTVGSAYLTVWSESVSSA